MNEPPPDRTEAHQPSDPLDAAMAAAFAPASGPPLIPHSPFRIPHSEMAAAFAPASGPPASSSVLRALGAGLPRVQLRQPEGEGPVVQPDSPEMPGGLGERYQLHGEIARGGMGAVFLGRDTDLGRDVAVKVLLEAHAGRTELLQRFVEEAQIAGQLQHPGVVPVYELGQSADRRPYFAMKLVKGDTLAKLLARRKTPEDGRPRWLGVFVQVCQAVAYAHARGVIHRDLKPSNVMVGGFGEVQVMDWGLAKVLPRGGVADERAARQQAEGLTAIRTRRSEGSAPGSGGTDTQAGSVMGTPAYMPPEQALGEVERLDERADVFALGSILCEILTGLPAYSGADAAQLHRKAVRADLDDALSRLDGSGADGELLALCKRCLAAEPDDRPRDAAEVAEGVSAYLQGVEQRLREAELKRGQAEVRAVEEARRRRVQRALGLALGLLLLGGVAFGWWQAEQGRVARERLARNGEAVAGLLGQCQQALRAGDAAGAAVTLEAARKRAAEGGADERAAELEQCQEDLAVLRDLDAVDQFRWTWVENTFPDAAAVAARYREVLGRFGADPDTVSAEQAAARVSASAVRERLVTALDRMLLVQKSAGVRAALRATDADPYRDAVRDAVRANDLPTVAKLASRAEALEQPPGFAAFLGESEAVGLERRRELLAAAVQRRPGELGLLMALGNTYPANQREGAEERSRWFQAAVAVAPANTAALNNLGNALKDKGDLEGAIAAYKQGIRLDPKFAYAHNNLGAALKDKGDVEGAFAAFKQAIRLDPTEAKAHNGLGIALKAKGDVEGAIAAFNEAIRLDPKFAPAHSNLGLALSDKGDVDGAIAAYQQAIRLDPKFAYAHNNLGVALKDKGDVEGAIAAYKDAIRLEPKYANAHTNLGNALYLRKDVEGAIAAHKEAIRLDPKLAIAHNGLAIALSAKGDVEGAIAAYKQAIRLDPKYAPAHYNLGLALKAKGDVEGAIAAYQQAIHLDPKFAVAYSNLGLALQDKGDVEGAIAACKEAIRLDPKFAYAHNNLGIALHDKGDVEGAIAAYKQAIRLDPKFAYAHYNLGLALKAKGDVEGAIAAYKEAIRLDPKFTPAHNNLGLALKDKGDVEGAIAAYKEAIRLDRKLANAHGALGQALLQQGSFAEAEKSTRKALDLLPPGHPMRSFAAQQLARCQRLAKLDQRLPRVLRGEDRPASANECLAFAQLCQLKRCHAAATRFCAEAFALEPKRAEDLVGQHRYNAACSAALAAAGQGKDADKRTPMNRLALRRQALTWLSADLHARQKQLHSGLPAEVNTARAALAHWQKDPDLAGLRDKEVLAKLPADEQKAFIQLWADVAALLKKAETPAHKEGKQ